MTRNFSGVAAVAVLVASTAASPPALADVTKSQCIDANTRGQELRRDAKLSAAREEFRTCSAPSCPALLRDDCTRRLDDIERAQPTIVFDVKDASGRDVSAVKVTVDGKPLADRLTGAALPVDPGEHAFAFEVAGQAPVTQSFVIKESERDRRERVVLGGASSPAASPAQAGAAAPAAAGSALPPGAPSSDEGLGTRKILALTAAGVGVAGVAVGSVLGIMASSQASQQKTDCASATSCSNHAAALSDHSSAATDGTISTVAFVAGGVFLALGGVLFFTGGHAAEPGAAAGLVIAPGVGPRSAGMLLKGEF